MRKTFLIISLFLSICFANACNIGTNDSIFYKNLAEIEKIIEQECQNDTTEVKCSSWKNSSFLLMCEILGIVKLEWRSFLDSSMFDPYPYINKNQLNFIKQWYSINREYVNCEKVFKFLYLWNMLNRENIDDYIKNSDFIDKEFEKELNKIYQMPTFVEKRVNVEKKKKRK